MDFLPSAEDSLLRTPPDAFHHFYAVYVANHGRLPQIVIDKIIDLWQNAETAEDYLQAWQHGYSAGLMNEDMEWI